MSGIFSWFFFGVHLVGGMGAVADVETRLSLDDAVRVALARSKSWQGERDLATSVRAMAAQSDARLYPKLSLEGSFRAQSIVPEVAMGPGKVRLSDHHSYSIGPTLSYTIWDGWQRSSRARAGESRAEGQEARAITAMEQVKLSTRVSYVQAALAAENLELARHAAELARSQNQEIRARYRTGTVSGLDAISSDAEVMNYKLKVTQAGSESTASVLDLEYFIGRPDAGAPRLLSMRELCENHHFKEGTPTIERHSILVSHRAFERAAVAQADAARGAYWPTLQLQLRSAFDYPNGPSFERIHQNSIGVNLSWSLFEFGAVQNEVEAMMADAHRFESEREEATYALQRDYEKASQRVKALIDEVTQAEILVEKQQKLAEMSYSAYQTGTISFSEVQSANLRLLEMQNRLGSIRAQYLIQSFTVLYLAESER